MISDLSSLVRQTVYEALWKTECYNQVSSENHQYLIMFGKYCAGTLNAKDIVSYVKSAVSRLVAFDKDLDKDIDKEFTNISELEKKVAHNCRMARWNILFGGLFLPFSTTISSISLGLALFFGIRGYLNKNQLASCLQENEDIRMNALTKPTEEWIKAMETAGYHVNQDLRSRGYVSYQQQRTSSA